MVFKLGSLNVEVQKISIFFDKTDLNGKSHKMVIITSSLYFTRSMFMVNAFTTREPYMSKILCFMKFTTP